MSILIEESTFVVFHPDIRMDKFSLIYPYIVSLEESPHLTYVHNSWEQMIPLT